MDAAVTDAEIAQMVTLQWNVRKLYPTFVKMSVQNQSEV